MNRLQTRLVLSHLLVVLIGVATTFVVVRLWAPTLFDRSMGVGMMGAARAGGGQLRQEFSDAVDTALLVGAGVGLVAAAVIGIVFAVRLVRPLERVRVATKRMAAGEYGVEVELPREAELAGLVEDVNRLGHELARTESRRLALLGDVAHEMRTPMTVVEGYVEGMIDGVIPTGSEELAQIGAEMRRLRRLAEDLSALSRSQEGRISLSVVPVDLNEVVAAAAERLRPQAVDAEIELVVVPAAAPLVVDADPDRLAQVVTNLVGNAVRATPAGGRVEVHIGRFEGRAGFQVVDTGMGLTAVELAHVFERFYRGEPSAAGRSDGSGVGLTIAQGIMRAHGGDVTATSAGRGLGARFTAHL